MKTYIFIILSFITVVLNAQSHRFADTTAQWNVKQYDYWNHTNPVITLTYRVLGDTLINNRTYQKMLKTPILPMGSGYVADVNYVRKDQSGKVLTIYFDTTEYLIYDFSKGVGDTITIIDFRGVGGPYSMVVDSVDTVILGRLRKRMFLGGYTWVEGMGAIAEYTSHPFYTMTDVGIPDAPIYTLLCFQENGEMLYHNENYDSCYVDVRVGIKDASLSNTLVYPNPTTNHFTLTLNKQPQSGTALLIHDGLGRMVKREELVSSTQQISVADLPDGLYTYTIMQNSVRQASGKLVVSQ